VISRSRIATAAAALLLVAAAASCGDEPEQSDTTASPTAAAADFPRPQRDQGLEDLRAELPPESLALAPSVSVLQPGRNRFGFGLFDAARKQIAEAPVALYLAPVGGGPVRGPFPARYESLAVGPQFESAGTASDPDAASGVYVAEARFEEPGRYQVLGVAAVGDRLVAATVPGPPLEVTRESPVPEVGEPAPRISTPTVASAGGAVEEIDTRVPPAPELHELDFAEAVGEQPVVLLFATPALCQSRVCGPVVDVTLEVKASHEGGVAFIHQEIYEDNELEAGFRPQVRAWSLPTEPWLFTVDRDGKVAARIEGAFSAGELERAIEAATRS
jgi:hypothetical protein